METRVKSPQGKEVVIGDAYPTVLIGERINPFGKGPIKDGMVSGNMEPIKAEAIKQVEAGADILIISVAAFGIDETIILPKATEAVMAAVDVPLCIESRNPKALDKALSLGCGRPIVSSVTGEKAMLDQLLPIAKKYDTALVILANDESGIPNNSAKRVEIITHIVKRAAGSRNKGGRPHRRLRGGIERRQQQRGPHDPGDHGHGEEGPGPQPGAWGEQRFLRPAGTEDHERRFPLSRSTGVSTRPSSTRRA